MRKSLLLTLGLALAATTTATAQSVEITADQAKSMYKATSMGRVSVHDPSIVYNPDDSYFYIFGSHRGQARTKTLQTWSSFTAPWGKVQSDGTIASGVSNSEAFSTQQVTEITIGGKTVSLQNFDAKAWSAAVSSGYSVDGNMWAPDIIWNEAMKKWCMYMSINGDKWASSIVLLTADEINGTYTYQGPVVISGFQWSTNSYKKTDLELVLGTLSALPDRYNQGNSWGTYWPNCIDPCVFYDEEGELWMTYGSWSGGIFILKLNKETGLRDYDYTYSSDYASKGASFTSDPYFGKKLAGGYYSSGEGSYVEHIGDYYYLFVTYGGLTSDGGYEMRVFRSSTPDGTYTDTKGNNARYTKYAKNFGVNSDTRGEKIIGAYDGWGFQTLGELAQGHNSIVHTADDQNLLVYHTRFNDGSEGHQVRVHQTYVNKDGWLVAAPFEYHNEETTDTDVKSKQPFAADDMLGEYSLLIHKYGLDYENREVVEPITIKLNSNGRITGDKTGKWELTDGTAYIKLTLGGVEYNGVVSEQEMDGQSIKAVCISAVASTNGHNIWAYKMRDDYALAYQINNMTMPVKSKQNVSSHLNLIDDLNLQTNIEYSWTSSDTTVISNTGRFNSEGLTEDEEITLTLRLTCGKYYYENPITVKAKADTTTTGDAWSGLVAYYSFDSTPFLNAYDENQKATKARETGGTVPGTETDNDRQSKFIHQWAAAAGSASYMKIDNPLYGQTLSDGITVSFWLKRAEADKTGCLFSFYDASTKHTLYLTGNTYIAYWIDDDNWTDFNNPSQTSPSSIPTNEWALLTVTLSETEGYTVYVDGKKKPVARYKGEKAGTAFTTKSDADFAAILAHVAACEMCYTGFGGAAGSADACIDDLLIYNRALTADDVARLYRNETRVYDFAGITEGIESVVGKQTSNGNIYDLSGRRITTPTRGIYIKDGKKIVIK